MADTVGTVGAGGIISYEVASTLDASWNITLTWSNPNADLRLQATVLACGDPRGCQVGSTFTASVTQPMIRTLKLDGRRGTRYRFDVLGDPALEQTFTIRGSYDTGVCT